MADKQELRIIREIAKQYGSIINLDEAPSVLAEILRNYGGTFAGGNLDKSSVSGCSVSAINQGVQTSGSGNAIAEPALSDVVRGILQLQRTVSGIDTQLKEIRGVKSLTSSRSPASLASSRPKHPTAKAAKRKRS